MKKICIPILIAVAGLLASCSNSTTVSVPDCNDSIDGDCVYICTGGSSKKYHSSDTCTALASCSKEVERVSIGYAEEKGRTPCKRCHK